MDSAVAPLPEDRVKDASVLKCVGSTLRGLWFYVEKERLGCSFLPALFSLRFILT
jgi:hypothetical protein